MLIIRRDRNGLEKVVNFSNIIEMYPFYGFVVASIIGRKESDVIKLGYYGTDEEARRVIGKILRNFSEIKYCLATECYSHFIFTMPKEEEV